MSRLITVSNRVGVPTPGATRAGGLESALREALEADGGVWFGWSGEVGETRSEKPTILKKGNVTFATVDLSRTDYDDYYLGYANSTLWPLVHYQLGRIEFHRQQFRGYIAVNEYLAKMLAPLVEPDDLIWVHDYHLIPLGEELRKLGIKNRIGFFLHTPLPPTDIMVALPHHDLIMQAFCAYDLIGLQTENGVRAFLDYIAREANGRLEFDGSLSAYDRLTRVIAFPIGIDTEHFVQERRARGADGRNATAQCQHRQPQADRRRRPDGLQQRCAHSVRGDRRPADRMAGRGGPVHLSADLAAVALRRSRAIRQLRRDIEHAAGHVNGKYSDIDWAPIRFVVRAVSRTALAGIYRSSRVGLVTPLRDGMNLVAKEYVASQDPEDPGVLVLSRFAGAAAELKTALLVNPIDPSEIGGAIHHALKMNLPERRERWQLMMEALRVNTIQTWTVEFPEGAAGDADAG